MNPKYWLLCLSSIAVIGCSGGEFPGSGQGGSGGPSTTLDGGTALLPDSGPSPQTKRPTQIAPVAGGGEASSEKYRGRISVTAPQPLGQTSSEKHKATLSVTGAQP